jgi:hypothetical protein
MNQEPRRNFLLLLSLLYPELRELTMFWFSDFDENNSSEAAQE